MKRTLILSLTATALIGLQACKGGSSAAASKLIPADAKIVGGVNISSLVKSKLYTDNKAAIEENAEAKETLEAMKACNLSFEKMGSLVIGSDGGNNVVVVATGEGIGDETNLKCIGDKIKEKQGSETAPFTIAEVEGKKVLTVEGEDDGKGFLVDKNTLVFASKGWETQVKELIDGKGKNAFDGDLKPILGRTDQSKHIWFAGQLPENMAGMLKAVPNGDGIKDFAGSLDLSSGITIALSAGTESAEKAKALVEEAQKQFDQVKGMATGFGVPEGVTNSVKFAANDNVVSVEAKISEADQKALEEKLGGVDQMLKNL